VALGIGVNTAIFSVVDTILLRPLPVKDPHELVKLSSQQKGVSSSLRFSYLEYRYVDESATDVFSGVMAYRFGLDALSVNNQADRVTVHYVSGNYFSVLGIKPFLGRLIQPNEGSHEGSDPVLVLGYSYWMERFAGDPSVIGRTVTMDGRPVTIIGVTPPQFHGAQATADIQGYLPLGMYGSIEGVFTNGFLNNPSLRLFDVMGRLKSPSSLRQAQAKLDLLAQSILRVYPRDFEGLELRAEPERSARLPGQSKALEIESALFLGMAAVILTLACVNLMNLEMIRATARQKEIAVRAALGASRSRLICQLLVENFLVAFVGATAGLLVGIWGTKAFSALNIQGIPIYLNFSFDWRVFVYALCGATVAALIIGIFPALRTSSVDLATVSREGGQRVSSGRQYLRSTLVMLQVAAAFTLVVLATLFARSLRNAQRVDLGFDPRGVVNFRIEPRLLGYDEVQGRELFRGIPAQVSKLPGIESACLSSFGPMFTSPVDARLKVDGYVPLPGQGTPSVFYNQVSNDFFQTLRIPIVQGRSFVESDDRHAPGRAIINQTMANRFWPHLDPIGRRFAFQSLPGYWIEVIGVARDSKYVGVDEPSQPYFYLSLQQVYSPVVTLRVRSQLAPAKVIEEVRKELSTVAPGLPITGVETMVEQLDGAAFGRFRIAAGFAVALGLLGLILALVGLYGVVSYTASHRKHEIGIRIALGAQRNTIRKLVLKQGLMVVLGGIAIGVILALLASPIIGQFVLGVSAHDPVMFGAVALLLLVVTLVACYVPVRRASRVDPITVLRHQ
jgi:predicted permease